MSKYNKFGISDGEAKSIENFQILIDQLNNLKHVENLREMELYALGTIFLLVRDVQVLGAGCTERY